MTIIAAVEALTAGRVVAIPTDTVYGIAARADDPVATRAIFAVKRRPEGVELPVLVADVAQAEALAQIDALAARLIERFWPGALTLVLPRKDGVVAHLGGDPTTVGLRCADHEVPQALCARVGPLATTSANRHGQATPPTAAEVRAVLGDEVALVVDGGSCTGLPSTVVDVTSGVPELLREGRIAWTTVLQAV